MSSPEPAGAGSMEATLRRLSERLDTLEATIEARWVALQSMLPDEIRRNSDKRRSLDEVVVRGCTAHLEQMSTRAWWLGLTKDKKTVHVWISCSRKGKLSVTVTEDELGCWDHVTDGGA